MITWKQLAQSVLGASAGLLYTAPTSTYATIQAANLWNPTGSPVAVKFYIVPVGGSETDATTVESITVPAGQSIQVPNLINHKITPQMMLWASGLGVTCTVSGAESV